LGDDRAARELVRVSVLNTRGAIVGERRPAQALNDAEIEALQLPG
jgi:hypothetical protein